MKLVQVILAGAVLVFGTIAWATVYEWIDNQGVVHLTDDPVRVPEAYRKTMKKRDINPELNTIPGSGEQSRSQTMGGPSSRDQEFELLGGHNKGWWQFAFREARDSIAELDAKIAAQKQALERLHRQRILYQKSSDRVAYYELKDEIEANEVQLKESQKKLDDLEGSADAAGVPQDWRAPSRQ